MCCLLLLPGCTREDSPVQETEEETMSADFIEPQVEQANANLQQYLGIDEDQLDDISVAQVQTYEDETIVRYMQTYRGVEIYGSSMVATSSDEEFLGGTYYDLSDAFGEDFDDQITVISQYPDWMTDSDVVTFHRDTYRPVIYITDDQQAHLAVCFQAQVTGSDVSERIEFVMSHDGTQVFLISAVHQVSGFSDTEVKTSFGTMTISKDGDRYYAYNRENNVYVTDIIFGTDSEQRKIDAAPYLEVEDGGRYPTPNFGKELIYSSPKDDWSTGKRDTALTLMKTFCNVNQWYGTQFGYWSLDGKGGVNILGVMEGSDGSPAINLAVTLIWAQPNAVSYPEIMTHEFFHSVFARTLGLDISNQGTNETAALNEALADTFGALYLLTSGESGSIRDAEDCWILARGLDGDEKDIPSKAYTMDDYLQDRYSDHEEYDTENPFSRDTFLYSLDVILDFIGTDNSIRLENSSTAESHHNAFIISHMMYRIWGDVLDRDADALGQILFRTIRYLPTNADFQDFREAFLYAMRLSYPAEKVAAAQGCFSNAGIEQKEEGRITKIQKQTAGSDIVTLENMMTMPYKNLKNMVWDEFYVSSSFDTPDTWGVQCSAGECYFTIYYHGYAAEDGDALPSQVSGQDFRKTGRKMAICDVIRTGMTYEEIARVADVPEPVLTQAGWTTSFPMNYYYFVRLFFEGDTESEELYSAEISPWEADAAPSEENTPYLLDYCTADFGTISVDFQDSFYTCPDIYGDGGNVWNCTCMIGQGLSLVFDFASDYEAPTSTPLYARIDDLMYWSGSTTGAELCPGLAMGMTYEEAAGRVDLTALEWAPEQTWSEPVYLSYGGAAGCALELYFIGSSEDTAVLVSVNAMPIN